MMLSRTMSPILAAFVSILLTAGCRHQNLISHRPTLPVQEHVERMKREVAGHQLAYLHHSPTGQRPEMGWPLLLFLHGYGECGNDLQKVKKHGPPKLIQQIPPLQGCVVISPQCPSDSWWRVEALHALVEEVISGRGDIDRNRLYVTGLSMGGYGIWSFLSHHPDYFAAAIPICGGGDPFRLPANRPPEKTGITNEFLPEGLRQAAEVAIWTFHGSKDASVPPLESERMIQLLREAGNPQTRLTVYPGLGHVGAWERAYLDPMVWEWLFRQSKQTGDDADGVSSSLPDRPATSIPLHRGP